MSDPFFCASWLSQNARLERIGQNGYKPLEQDQVQRAGDGGLET